MIKRILPILTLVLVVVLLTTGLIACNEDGGAKYLNPPFVTLTGNVASWSANEKASSFEISMGGSLIKVENSVTSRTLAEGVPFKVRAVGDGVNYLTSDWSNTVTYTAQAIQGSKDINFVMINDTHGALTDSAEGYSIGRIDSLITSLESKKGDQIFIHNGDAFQGSYVCGETYGLALVEALNEMSLDCFVLGNHEFDWGIDKISAYADGDESNGEANFPFLGANIYFKGTTTRPEWIDAYTIVEQDGVKVGIIGIMGDSQESSILTRYVKDYDFVPPMSIISSTASNLRANLGCDVVVVATHEYSSSLNENIASLSGNSRIDAIFGAHTHQNKEEFYERSDYKEIPAVQCYHKNNNLSEVILYLDASNDYVSAEITKHRPYNYPISNEVQTVINKYQDVLDEAEEVLCIAPYGYSNSDLGGFATETMLNNDYEGYDFGDVDISIINTGGVRADINAGEITRGEVFEVFPFNNAVVLVNIRGELIKSICNQNSGYLYVGGNYNALSDNEIYQLAVIDYVFENTRYDQFDNLASSDYIETDVLLRDLLIEYFDEDEEETPPTGGNDPVTPPVEEGAEEVTIAEFISRFNEFKNTEATVSGKAYTCDNNGFYLDDGTGTLYVYTAYSNLFMGQIVTVTGKAGTSYSMPRLVPTESIVYGEIQSAINTPSTETPIATILEENADQSSMVYDHTTYRTVGVVKQVNGYYCLVDGTNKLQFAGSVFNDDMNAILACLNKKIAINVVICDYFLSTSTFRIVPLRGYLNIEWELDDSEQEEPDFEPNRIETNIADLVATPPSEYQTVIYIVEGTWSVNNDVNGSTYGNGYLRDELSNQIKVYGLCSSDSVVSWNGSSYDFSNNRSYSSIGLQNGDKIRVGMLYDTNYKNYKCFFISKLEEDESPKNVINFIEINDTHGAFVDSEEGYSIGRVDTLVSNLEAQSSTDYIFIHNGDAFQGSYVSGETYGLALVEALNEMSLDCFVIGNHEFDWGIDKIATYADGNASNGEANFPFLGANIFYAGTTTRPEWIDAYTIVERGEVKVGIIGVMGYGQEDSILTRYADPYDFAEPVAIVATTASYLRVTEECDIVVVATHDYDENYNTRYANLSGNSRIDGIFTAHTHQDINYYLTRSDGKQIAVVQSLHKNNQASTISITLDESNSYLSSVYNEYSPASYAISSDVQTIIAKYQDIIDDGNSVIGNSGTMLDKGTLGGYAVDAMINYTYADNTFGDVDIAVLNTGGVRATIKAGEITKAEVFEVFPFNNMVVIVNMKGSVFTEVYENNVSYLYVDARGTIGDSALEPDRMYQVAVIDYVYENKYYPEFRECESIQTNVLMRDIFIEFIENEL